MESMEYIPGVSNGYGARLTVSEPGTYPYPSDEGLDISSSMETSIGLKMVMLSDSLLFCFDFYHVYINVFHYDAIFALASAGIW